jgi:hypothetical protein
LAKESLAAEWKIRNKLSPERSGGMYFKEGNMPAVKKVASKKAVVKKTKKMELSAESATVAPALPAKPVTRATQAKPKTAEIASTGPVLYVVIDHPINGEVLIPNHYAVRIGASWGGIVEFQVDDTDWIPCRHNAGYWWFDWHNIPSGKHKLAARMIDNNGNVLKKSALRRVEVK